MPGGADVKDRRRLNLTCCVLLREMPRFALLKPPRPRPPILTEETQIPLKETVDILRRLPTGATVPTAMSRPLFGQYAFFPEHKRCGVLDGSGDGAGP